MNELKAQLIAHLRADIPTIDKLGKMTNDNINHIILQSTMVTVFGNANGNFDEAKKQCWLWEGRIDPTPGKGHEHGRMMYKKKNVQVHRLMMHNFIKDVPEFKREKDALWVLHTCTHENNGRCINPWHLRLGTPKENIEDSKRDGTKGECKVGAENHNAKLTDDKIKEIIALKDNRKDENGKTLSQREIAEKYGIHQSQISRYWNDVTRAQYIKQDDAENDPNDENNETDDSETDDEEIEIK